MEDIAVYIGLIIWWSILFFIYFPAVRKDQRERLIHPISAFITRGILFFGAILYTVSVATNKNASFEGSIAMIIVAYVLTYLALPNKDEFKNKMRILLGFSPTEHALKKSDVEELQSMLENDHQEREYLEEEENLSPPPIKDTSIDLLSYIAEKEGAPLQNISDSPLPNPDRLDQVSFTYQDSMGDITDRTVMLHAVDRYYFTGFCLTRQAQRKFRKDRVIQYHGDSLNRINHYEENRGKQQKREEALHCVFLGFDEATLKLLHALANTNNIKIRQNITKNTFAVIHNNELDENRQARIKKHNALSMNKDQFIHFVETGEIESN